MNVVELNQLCKEIRLDVLDMAYRCDGPAHLGGALSIVEILAVLYGSVMNHQPDDPRWEGRDRFILSKGHGVLSFYSALYRFGYFDYEKILTFKENGTDLIAHPVMNLDLGIESSNGSLGHGLSMCAGIAWALRHKNSDSKVFAIIGDGECDEGSIWEAAMSASRLKLGNIVAIIDCNGFQSDGPVQNDSSSETMQEKWEACGWNTKIINGHSIEELLVAFESESSITKLMPTVIIARTNKGYGISFMANNNSWHHNRLTQNNYELARAEILDE
jgi:transketolase